MTESSDHAARGPRPVAVIAPAHARALSERLAAALPARLEVAETGDLTAALQESFAQGEAIVALCAAGIVIRALSPLLADKW